MGLFGASAAAFSTCTAHSLLPISSGQSPRMKQTAGDERRTEPPHVSTQSVGLDLNRESSLYESIFYNSMKSIYCMHHTVPM